MGLTIQNVLTVTMNDNGDIDNYSIRVEGERIHDISRDAIAARSGDRVIDGSHFIAIPGFFNSHVHCDITLTRGLGDGLTLYEQDFDSLVSRKKWFRKELNTEARHYSRLLQYAEALKGGTTFICDVPFWWYGDDLSGPFREIGVSGAVVLDYRKDFLTGELVEKEEYSNTAARLREDGYMPIVEAPAEEGFEEDLLVGLHDFAAELDTLLHLHLAETTWRMDIMHERFNRSSVQYLHEIGVLDRRILGSHAVYLDDTDRRLIHDCGARIVNCPVAEMKIADGIAPIVDLLALNAPLALGTDGALWNDSADMFAEMKNLMLLQRIAKGADAIGAIDCFRAATIGGARVFGLEEELGSIEEGKLASIVLIDTRKTHLRPLHRGEHSNILQILTSCARASDVHTVIVKGEIVVDAGRLVTIDEKALIEKCQSIADTRFH